MQETSEFCHGRETPLFALAAPPPTKLKFLSMPKAQIEPGDPLEEAENLFPVTSGLLPSARTQCLVGNFSFSVTAQDQENSLPSGDKPIM